MKNKLNLKKWIKQQFTIYTINKKIFLISKIISITIIAFIIFSIKLTKNSFIGTLSLILVIFILLIILELVLYKFIAEPISQLENIAKKMSQLDFSEYCDLHTKDEFESLGNNLNIMAINLENALKDLEIANKRLKNDVEREQYLLKQRKELVDSLSHEMKTPLGIIKAYAEGAIDTKDENIRKEYLNTIIDETDEVTKLINSLLDLSALKSGVFILKQESFDIVELVETVAGRLLVDVDKKNYILEFELPENKVLINSDKKGMEQVLNNLILNAKKYVKVDGIIKLYLEKIDNNVVFSIYNEANYISEDNINKIWNKFFTTSDSGSGLGLTIVSELLILQNIEYKVENIGKGIKFSFIISDQ